MEFDPFRLLLCSSFFSSEFRFTFSEDVFGEVSLGGEAVPKFFSEENLRIVFSSNSSDRLLPRGRFFLPSR